MCYNKGRGLLGGQSQAGETFLWEIMGFERQILYCLDTELLHVSNIYIYVYILNMELYILNMIILQQ